MSVSVKVMTIILTLFIFYITFDLVQSQTTCIGISLSKYQWEDEIYIKFPNAEALENPLKSFKVLTRTRCESSCSVVPETCKSYNLRYIEGEKHMKMCELFGPYLTSESPTNTTKDVDHYMRKASCRENGEQLISGDTYYVNDAGITASSTHSPGLSTLQSRLDTQGFSQEMWTLTPKLQTRLSPLSLLDLCALILNLGMSICP
ncbi:unnamed protein product [Owenia fusiformis]|uniref:Apple domain-containing protein n=1 Tax=Owenia fusiformis TaxID=6347 RepID=A0A8S4PQ48_OWEFU|nr:unnamed protein product [Owenia fusiformis]